jgi:fibrillarin-like pre-rRNA processing protein
MSPETIFPSVYSIKGNDTELIATLNLTPGLQVYGEQLILVEGSEYRAWTPYRSKLSAAIRKGLKTLPLGPEDLVLYLGVASGTTCSHISDIVGQKGHVWGLDFAPRSMRDFINNVARYRENLSPILGDARKPETYTSIVPNVDIIYVDIAQPDQADLAVKNAAHFLKPGGSLMMAIKSRSVDVTVSPSRVYEGQLKVLSEAFNIVEVLELDPFEKDHAFVTATYQE